MKNIMDALDRGRCRSGIYLQGDIWLECGKISNVKNGEDHV